MKKALFWQKPLLSAALMASSTCAWAQIAPAPKACLLEMFTSEFCAYCQQAEQWVAENQVSIKPNVVLLPEHVQSFDTPEKKDPYASKAMTERHKSYRALGKSQFVATPQFFYNGQETRNWKDALTRSCKSNSLYGLSLKGQAKVGLKRAQVEALAQLENLTGYQYNHKVYFAVVEQTKQGKFIVRHLSQATDIQEAQARLEPISLALEPSSSYNLVAFVQNIHTLEVYDVSFLNIGALKASN